jgi:hypothetical protein
MLLRKAICADPQSKFAIFADCADIVRRDKPDFSGAQISTMAKFTFFFEPGCFLIGQLKLTRGCSDL